MKRRIAIIGAGDLGQQIAYFAAQEGMDVVGFFDDTYERLSVINNLSVLGGIDEVESAFTQNIFDALLIGIGYKHMDFKEKIFNNLSKKIPFATLIHKSCQIDASAKIGQGSVLFPGCLIDQQVEIGENTLLNVSCSISHDTLVGSHSFLSPRVAVAGFVKIEEKCIIGINATIIDNIRIKKGAQLGGGTVVIKDIVESGLYVGNPARFIR